jgi:hypothetical protein
MAERVLLADVKEIAESVVSQAKAGSSWASALVLRLLLPPARERLMPFQLPPINGVADVVDAVQAVLGAASRGELTLGEAERIAALLENLRAAYESRDLVSQVEQMRSEIEALRTHGNGGNGTSYGRALS